MEMKMEEAVKKMSKLDARLHSASKILTTKTRYTPEKEYFYETSSQIENPIQVEPNLEKLIDFLDSKLVYESLDKILTFLKSDKNEMCFPKLSRFLELFVANIVKDINNLTCNKFDNKCKKVCEQIISIININNHVYKWDCRQERRNEKDVLVFTKDYITPSKTDKFRAPRTISTRQSQRLLASNMKNLQTAQINNQQELTTRFRIHWLNNILKFIKDDTQLTLKYPEMTSQEVKFVNSLITKNNFDNDVGFGYKSLYAPLREAMEIFSLKYDFGIGIDTENEADLSCLLLVKIPKTCVKEPADNVKQQNNMSATKTIPPQKETGDASLEQVNRLFEAVKVTSDKESVSDKQHTKTCPSRDDLPKSSKINEILTRQENKADKRKMLLMQAMSVPVTSDKAMKMMSNMGWEGGALGRTGEGITEPIIPALDLVSGAGLGHVPPPKNVKMNSPKKGKKFNNPRLRVCFRTELLQHILNLVISEESTREIEYSTPLCKKEKGFMKQALGCINSRSRLGLEGTEMTLYLKLLEELSLASDVQMNVTTSDNNKSVTLTKTCIRNIPTGKLSYNSPWNTDATVSITPSVIKDNVAMILPRCQQYMTNKALLALSFRITVLTQVLGFIRSDLVVGEIVLKNKLNKKQCTFIENAIVKVNKKERGASTELEREILDDIAESDIQCSLNVQFSNESGSMKVIVLEKIYNEKRFPITINDTPDTLYDITTNNNNREKVNIVVTIDNTVNNNSVTTNVNNKLGKGSDGVMPKDASPIMISESNSDADLESDFTDEEHLQMEKDKLIVHKYVRLVPKNYPKEITDLKFAKKIQHSISKHLDNCNNILPLLKCHGVQDGALVYSCHTEKSYSWLHSVCVASDVKIINSNIVCDTIGYKMAVRVNTYIDECYTRLFDRLESYNEGLRTRRWTLVKKEQHGEFIVVVVKIDEMSFNYVKEAGFRLFAGVDEARFTIVWD